MAGADIPVPPSGRQVEIRHGNQSAVVVEVGGGLRTYDAAGRAVLDGYGVDEMASAGRGQPLIPWPNRLRQGRYSWDGKDLQAPLNDPGKGNANHGLTRWQRWDVAARTRSAARATLRLYPQPGYPFALDLAIDYSLADDGLTVTTTARNIGADACPYGFGAHPYVTVGVPLDEVTLHLPAASYLTTDEAQIPIGRAAVDDTPYDFREPQLIGAERIDATFTDLRRGEDGRVEVTLTGPGDVGVVVWADESTRYLQVYTGDSLPQPERRRRGLAVEPMTCPPNAFATGEDVRRLEPGETVTTRCGIRPGA